MLDLAAGDDSAETIARTQAMKTGALFRYACAAGATLGRALPPERDRLATFGAKLGLAFQIADDLIDATGDAATAGKATAKDAGRGKRTFVGLHGIDGARRMLDATIAEAEALLAPFGANAHVLVAAVRFTGRREA